MMRRVRVWAVRLAAQLGLTRRREFDEELASLVELHIDDNLRAGMSPDEARRTAMVAVGSRVALRDAYLDRAGVPLMRVLKDAGREGFRSLTRHRAFSLAVIAILSLGVGATAALVSLVDTLLFRPPAHVTAPHRLVRVVGAPNYPLFETVSQQSRTLDVAAVARRTLSLGQGEHARSIEAECVTADYFRVLGARPVAGRAFDPHDDGRGGQPTAVLGYGLWRREFGTDPAVIGRSVTIAGRPHLVAGIAPPDFRGLQMSPVDAWILLAASPDECSLTGRSLLDSVSAGWLTTIGRLRDGVAIESAEAEIRTLALHALRSPGSDPPQRHLEPIQSQRSRMRDSQLAIWFAAGAGLILAIGCANVAGLLSTRAIERRRELGVRFQLGASRARLVTQLVAENLVLAAGCTLGAATVSLLMTAAFRGFFPAVARDAWIDTRALGVVALFALVSGLIGGLIPAIQATRLHTATAWRVGQEVGQTRARWRHVLVVAQVTLALVLIAGAGLFSRSVRNAKSDLGYDLDGVIVATLDLERAGIRRQLEKRRLFDEMLRQVLSLPGIEAASLSSAAPLGSGQFSAVMPSAPPGGGRREGLSITLASVSPDYFKTMGTRIVAGRPFTSEDGVGAPRVAVVDTTLAREMWPGASVVGQCKPFAPGQPCVEIVGLSEPRRIQLLTAPAGEIFYPLAQGESVPQAILIRPTGRMREAIPAVTLAIQRVSPTLPFVNVRPLEDLADARARSWRLGAMLFGLFGAVAIVLAAVGIYASLAFTIRQRTAEIGVRMALGATRGRIARMTLWQGARLIGLGWACGLIASVVFAIGVEHLLFGVSSTDPLTFVLGSASICAAGAAGCLLPAVRASRVDPVVALRTE